VETIPLVIPVVKRKKTSIWVDPAIWVPFVKACRSQGDSSCAVLEPYMYGYTYAVKKGMPVKVADLTLNLTVNRIVERPRRRIRRGVADNEIVIIGSSSSCAFCGDLPRYKTTRWPSRDLCLHEFVCELCKWRLSHLVKTLGVETLPFQSAREFGGD